MTFSQFVALLAFLSSSLPLGAIAMVAALYGTVALGRVPVEAAMLFERLAGRAYCWAMIGVLAVAFLVIGGWTARLLLLAVIASFLRGVLDLLPRLEALRSGGPVLEPASVARLAHWRRVIAGACALQWLVLLIVYVKLVL
ncbi:MAG: hypothetical protein PVG24_11800 [Gammaproteobacteria bacterium]|jgi:hypothetical protein